MVRNRNVKKNTGLHLCRYQLAQTMVYKLLIKIASASLSLLFMELN